MSEIKDGDVVCFVAGSPPMLVTEVNADGLARVNWFNAITGRYDSDLIPASYLLIRKTEEDTHEQD